MKKELLDQCFVATRQNPAYGLTFWLGKGRGLGSDAGIASGLNRSEDVTPELGLPRDTVMANGLGGQRLLVSREAKFVVVGQSDALAIALRRVDASGWSDRKFLQLLLDKPK